MGITFHQFKPFEQNQANVLKQMSIFKMQFADFAKRLQLMELYVKNAEGHFEILDSYNFFKVTDLKTETEMSIKSKKREAIALAIPAVADVEFLIQENARRKQEIVDNVLDDDRQDEIARQIAAKGDRVYAELSQTANNAQVAATAAATAANTAQTTANQAKTAAEKGINDASVALGMAFKAHETAESVQNDLAELDTVVETTFTSLESKGFLSAIPAPAPAPNDPIQRTINVREGLSFPEYGGKILTIEVAGYGSKDIYPDFNGVDWGGLSMVGTPDYFAISNSTMSPITFTLKY